MGAAIAWMVTCLISVGLLASGTQAVPPGNEWQWRHTAAVVVLIVGAFVSARHYRGRLIFLLFGALGGSMIMPVLLPDSRDYLSIGRGHESIWSYIFRSCGLVVVMGMACYLTAALSRLRQDALARRVDPRRCRKCGYPLFGLTERRCPECATPFDHEIRTPPAKHA
jgi:hypothetical protein